MHWNGVLCLSLALILYLFGARGVDCERRSLEQRMHTVAWTVVVVVPAKEQSSTRAA